MTQLSGNGFEDDLTVGMEESSPFSTDSIDLFGITGNDESPIARLKSIILSIDWEISDEILKQLDVELLDLGEIWAGDKIKQVYVQGLRKIGRYICKEKAGAHPDAIKLLLTFYHNLEQVVLDGGMGEKEKRQLLLSDVRKFDQLKGHIGRPAEPPAVETIEHESVAATGGFGEDSEDVKELKGLKAQVLGIDWEINDLELEKLGAEVTRLEGVFTTNRPKLILLQGIGALSAYINKMRSKSSRNAFVLLHSFYDVLEKISGNTLSASEEKQLLLAEVSKFKEFKAEISTQQSGDAPAVAGKSDLTDEHNLTEPASPIVQEEYPASMSVSETTTEEVMPPDEVEVSDDVSSCLSSVFGDDNFEDSEFGDSDKIKALEGVDVETEADDESDEDALPFEHGTVAPALAEMDEDSSFSVERLADDLSVAPPTVAPQAIVGDDIEAEDYILDIEDVGEAKDSFLQGIDVETEADDDSDEDSLPMTDGALAPALSGADDDSGLDANSVSSEFDEADSDAIESRLGEFFDDEVATSSESWGVEKEEEILEADDEIPGDEEGLIAALSEAFDDKEEDEVEESKQIFAADDEQLEDEGSLASALSVFDEEDDGNGQSPDAEQVLEVDDEKPEDEESLVAALSQFDDDFDGAIEGKVDIEDENLDDGESLVAALSDTDDEQIADIKAIEQVETAEEREEAGIEQEFELFEEEAVTLAFSDPDTVDDVAVEAEAEDAVEIELAFLDKAEEPSSIKDLVDEDALPVAGIIEDEGIAFEVESEDIGDDDEIELSVPSAETTDIFTISDTVDDVAVEAKAEDAVEIELAFLDEAEEPSISKDLVDEDALSFADIIEDEGIAFEVESEDIGDDDEIEFTLPGTEITDTLTIPDDKTDEEDDLIEFDVPGEVEGSALLFDEEESSDEIVFETVGDDVPLDLLPGEEFDDSESLATELDITDTHDDIQLTAADRDETEDDLSEDVEKSVTGKYESLAIMGAALQENVTEEVVQDVLVELNKLGSAKDTDYTDKTFLQLLSTLCQYIEKNKTNEHAISLMQDIVSGLEMRGGENVTFGNVQESLFSCTSRLLVLQREEMDSLESDLYQGSNEDSQTDRDLDDVDGLQDELGSEKVPLKSLGDDEQLASFVQKELSDIRKLFFEEIGSLRKELSSKHVNM